MSFLAALDTDHKHKFSFTYLTYISDILSLTPKSFGARSIFLKVCRHEDRYSIEVLVQSLFKTEPLLVLNVTESLLTKEQEDTASVKPIAKARPRQNPTVTLTFVSIPVLERKWIDIETQRSHDQKCFEVSQAMTRLLRHDQAVPRGSDGAIHMQEEEVRRLFAVVT